MSHKRYQFKVIEAADAAELEAKLREAGTRLWSAVGYGVLPDGRRSVLLERKLKIRNKHHSHQDRPQEISSCPGFRRVRKCPGRTHPLAGFGRHCIGREIELLPGDPARPGVFRSRRMGPGAASVTGCWLDRC